MEGFSGFCSQNSHCPDHGKRGAGNLSVYAHYACMPFEHYLANTAMKQKAIVALAHKLAVILCRLAAARCPTYQACKTCRARWRVPPNAPGAQEGTREGYELAHGAFVPVPAGLLAQQVADALGRQVRLLGIMSVTASSPILQNFSRFSNRPGSTPQ